MSCLVWMEIEMSQTDARRPMAGSRPKQLAGVRSVASAESDETIRVTLVLRPGLNDQALARREEQERLLPQQRARLEPRLLEAIHGAELRRQEQVESFARSHGLEVVTSSRLRHDVVVEGAVEQIEQALGLKLELVEAESVSGQQSPAVYRSHRGPVHLPAALHDIVEGVLGLDECPRLGPSLGVSSTSGIDPRRQAELYGLSATALGSGQRVAILVFGGGAWSEDLDAYFKATGRPAPRIAWHSVLNAKNEPLDRETLGRVVAATREPGMSGARLVERFGADLMRQAQATLETTMDIEIVGAIAGQAQIDVYTAPDTASGFYEAIHAALGTADGSAATTGDAEDQEARSAALPAAISISWANAESSWTATHLRPIHRALELARSLGVPVCCASGDSGSSSGDPSIGNLAGVLFPASSPAALACGGTGPGAHGETGARGPTRARVWNSTFLGIHGASGGGVSGFFPRPEYQAAVRLDSSEPVMGATWISDTINAPKTFAGRAVPDVAAHADPRTGYKILAGGEQTFGGGTSASAPFWAAVLACLSSSLGAPVGWLNTLLYGDGFAGAFYPVTEGNNDVSGGAQLYYRAAAPWNACTGLGIPRLDHLLACLAGTGKGDA